MQESNSTLITEEVPDAGNDLCGNCSDVLFPIVAIGLAAGGMEAVSELLKDLPPSLGMIYIIIQSGQSNQEEILPDHLSGNTKMKVNRAEDEMLLERDQVYIIPPDTYMCIGERKLVLFPRARTEGGYHSIDFFLEALAAGCREKAIAIILSGITVDGAAGIRAVRAEGGITIAQDDTARFKGMPHNAIASGYIDLVLSPGQMALELADLKKYLLQEGNRMGDDNTREIGLISRFLLERFKLDITLWRPMIVNSRILRRMRLNRIPDLETYTRFLQDDDREADLLHRDLLLHMTSFFREPEIYQALTKNILPALLKNRKTWETFRVWIPACFTGEEAWSAAIIIHEYWKDNGTNIPLQIFATDMSAEAIRKARSGLYNKISVQNVSNRRLKEYFTRTGAGYQVIQPLRDLCVFAVHDLLNDPPFSHIDLICCENRLISFEPGPLEKAARVFHYALKSLGYILLGRFGKTGLPAELFRPSDEDRCSFIKKDWKAPRRDFFLTEQVSAAQETPSRSNSGKDPGREAERGLLSRNVPPGILIDKDLRILEMEEDLRAARQQLLTMSEAFEKTQEDLRFAYEESLSMNEEMKSRNEQLEGAGQDGRSALSALQKINKELYTRCDAWKQSALDARAVIDTIGEPLLVLNGNGRVHSANRALYELFHLRPGQVEGHYLHEIDHDLFDIAELESRLQSILLKRTGEADLEWKGAFFGLGERVFVFRLKRMIGGAGLASHILLTLEDVTGRRMAERRKDEFIGIASHELKTPVTNIQAYSQILYSELLEANDQRSAHLVNKLNNQVARLTRLTKDLLDLTSIAEGQLRLNVGSFDLNVLVDEIVEEMQRTTGHRIIKKEMPRLPEIWADRERMAQVLTNLVANAIKYSPEAEEVQLSAVAGMDRVYLSIKDFGMGIPEEIRGKVFERFFRAEHFAQTHSSGLGLGLYISYEIVRQHGGTITIDSEKGKGSVFTVTLPVHQRSFS